MTLSESTGPLTISLCVVMAREEAMLKWDPRGGRPTSRPPPPEASLRLMHLQAHAALAPSALNPPRLLGKSECLGQAGKRVGESVHSTAPKGHEVKCQVQVPIKR